MDIKRFNFANPIIEKAMPYVIGCDKPIVWYGGKRTLNIIIDCFRICGKTIDYYLTDEQTSDVFVDLKYSENIPMCNRHIHIDITPSEILSNYHSKSAQPRIVDFNQIVHMKDDCIFMISSDRAKDIKEILINLGVDELNIVVLPTDHECYLIKESKVKNEFRNMHKIELDEIHQTEFDLLKEFRNYCESKGLRYWLAGGTMLGAVRHSGFIPWDDDIDVYMPDKDYQVFVDEYKDSERYTLLHYERKPDYPYYFAKLTRNGSCIHHKGFPLNSTMGIYIDIFPLVGFPSDPNAQKEQWQMEHLAMAEWYWYQDLVDLVGKDKMPIQLEDIVKRLKPMPFDSADYIGTVSVILQKEWLSKRVDFDNTVKCKFMGELFNIPQGYKDHLSCRYGDFMALPPKEKQVCHGFDMYMCD